MKQNRPIGIFDSGVGGLTVLETLARLLPCENFYYVADQGHCPYGVKSAAEITARVEKITRHLINAGGKAIVIACNTATVFIEKAREIAGDIPVIGVIEPACTLAAKVTCNKKVAVLATAATVRSGVYQRLLEARGIMPVALACGEFVDFIENNGVDHPDGRKIVSGRLAALEGSGVDTVIHACTHFGLLENHMREFLGGGVKFVHCGEAVSEILPNILAERNLLNGSKIKGMIEIYTTGEVNKAVSAMKWFKTAHNPVKKAEIE